MKMETTPQAADKAESPKTVPVETPVQKESLDRLRDMEITRTRLGHQLIDLENEKISILAAARRIDDERNKLFQVLLMERGLAPNTPASIDPETGVLTVLQQKPPTE
jgi:hypothetical protein